MFYMPNGGILHIHRLNITKLRTSICLFATEEIFFSMRLHVLDIESVFCSQRSAFLRIPFGCYFVRELIAVMKHYCALNVSIEQRTIFKFNLVHFFIMEFLAQQPYCVLQKKSRKHDSNTFNKKQQMKTHRRRKRRKNHIRYNC